LSGSLAGLATLTGLALAAGGCQKNGNKKNEQTTRTAKPEPAGPAGSMGQARPAERAGPAEDRAARGRAAHRRAGSRRAAADPGNGPKLVKRWSAGGLEVPESVLYDPAEKVLYVSCIHGKPTEKNGQGYLAKLSLQGKVLAPKWATGFNAPKGMGIAGETLYVTDIDRLHAVDKKTGKISRTIEVPGAKFLNDIAIDANGKVYVSDMVTRKVHRLEGEKGDKLPVFVDTSAFKGANGLLAQGGDLLVGSEQGIVKVDLATAKATLHVPVKGFGMIDGLKAYGDGAYLVSNWKGKTQLVQREGPTRVLLDTTADKVQSADFEYIADQRLLLIPTFFDGHVKAYRIER